LYQPHLFDRTKNVWAGVHANSGTQDGALKILQRLGLPHDILARKIVSALFEHLSQRFCGGVAENRVTVLQRGAPYDCRGKPGKFQPAKAGLTSDSLKPGERPSQVLVVVADLLTGKRASRAHIGGMDQILPPELNDLEFEALRQLAAHPITHHIPSRIQSRLKDIGYAKEVLGGIVLTKDGLQRISEGK
jgi:hypothetical protein